MAQVSYSSFGKYKYLYYLAIILIFAVLIVGAYFVFDLLYGQYLNSIDIDYLEVEKNKIKFNISQYQEVKKNISDLQYYIK